MKQRGCRDCSRCTESVFASLLLALPRLLLTLLFGWNIGLFQRHCPHCGHRMGVHSRRPDGSFKD